MVPGIHRRCGQRFIRWRKTAEHQVGVWEEAALRAWGSSGGPEHPGLGAEPERAREA